MQNLKKKRIEENEIWISSKGKKIQYIFLQNNLILKNYLIKCYQKIKVWL